MPVGGDAWSTLLGSNTRGKAGGQAWGKGRPVDLSHGSDPESPHGSCGAHFPSAMTVRALLVGMSCLLCEWGAVPCGNIVDSTRLMGVERG